MTIQTLITELDKVRGDIEKMTLLVRAFNKKNLKNYIWVNERDFDGLFVGEGLDSFIASADYSMGDLHLIDKDMYDTLLYFNNKVLCSNITSDKVFKLVEEFESVLHLASSPNNLVAGAYWVDKTGLGDMLRLSHAGWYARAFKGSPRYSRIMRRGDYLTVSDGILWMSQDLGFRYKHQLMLWAKWNPEIWGNKRGQYMFETSTAFRSKFILEYNRPLTLQDIINHWGNVGMRLLTEELYKEGEL